MLHVNVSLSRKLSKDYNSSGFSINLEGEVTAPVSDPEAVGEQIKELFDLAEEALNRQIERGEGESTIATREVKSPAKTNGDRQESANGNRDEAPATNKQVNFMLAIGKRLGLTTAQLEARMAEILGHPAGLYDVSKKAAGLVIDALTNQSSEPASTSRF